MEEVVGPLFIPNPRFVIDQGGKKRPVDDGSVYKQNATISVPWKLQLGGVDEIVAIAITILRCVDGSRKVRIKLPSGVVLEGTLSPEWSLEDVRELVGRLGDMKGAYRQLASYPGHRYASVVTVLNETGELRHFLALALLFGQSGAVFGFNRVSRFLSVLAAVKCDLINSPYYDDFTQIEFKRLAFSARQCFHDLFEILGFDLALEPKKNKDFAPMFDPLGVRINLSDSRAGIVCIEAKPSRVEEITHICEDRVKKDEMTSSDTSSLVGKLRFLREGYFGRCGATALRELQLHESSHEPGPLPKKLVMSMRWLVNYFLTAPPRKIDCFGTSAPVHIFTDGASEFERVTVGGVLFELDFQPEAFGAIVPDEIVAKWRAGRHWQVIGQAELAPVFIATKLWEERLRNRHVIIWIDQNAARQSLIKRVLT